MNDPKTVHKNKREKDKAATKAKKQKEAERQKAKKMKRLSPNQLANAESGLLRLLVDVDVDVHHKPTIKTL